METISEVDLEIVHAVQVEPRASWATISATLEVSAATAARRWAALQDAGVAWTGATIAPERFRGAVVEARCAPGRSDAVIEALCEHPDVYTVGRTAGKYDLFALTLSPTPQRLVACLDQVGRLPLAGHRAWVYPRVFGGPRWTLGVLSRTQVDAVREPAPRPSRGWPPSPFETAVFTALSADGRCSLADLGGEMGMSASSVGRRLGQVRRHGSLDLRADVARPLAGWPWAAMLWVAVPDALVDQVGRDVGGWPEVRFCAPVVATATLVLVVNLRDPDELEAIGARLVARHRQVQVTDRRVVLRLEKVHGHVLDKEGRSTRLVPLQPW